MNVAKEHNKSEMPSVTNIMKIDMSKKQKKFILPEVVGTVNTSQNKKCQRDIMEVWEFNVWLFETPGKHIYENP